MSLFISVKKPTADLDKSPIDKAIIYYATGIATQKRGGHLPGGPKLDLTFMLSTAQDAPPFEGMRMGAYNDRDNTLYVHVAVPEKISQSRIAPQYVQAILLDTIDNAQVYFSDMSIAFDANKWRHAIDQLGMPAAND